jgi:hypothetical protein
LSKKDRQEKNHLEKKPRKGLLLLDPRFSCLVETTPNWCVFPLEGGCPKIDTLVLDAKDRLPFLQCELSGI